LNFIEMKLMGWICYSQGISCWCPSPMETIKSGAVNIYEATRDGILKLTEAIEATKNYVADKVNQISDGLKSIGIDYVENIQELISLASHLYEQFLEPAIQKIMEWLQYMVEIMLEQLANLIKTLGDAVYNTSVWIYKKIFSIALGLEDFGDLMKDIFLEIVKLIDPEIRELEGELGERIKEIEPYGTIFTLLEGFQTVVDFLTNIINPEKLLQNLVDTYIRPWVVDYFKELLPLEKIPIPEIEDLILNIACDNIFNVGQLFGHPTAGLEKTLERVTRFLVKRAMEGAVSIRDAPESDVPGWAWDIVITFLTLEGIVVGVVSFGGGKEAIPPKFSQVGTAISIIGIALGILNLLSIAGNYISADFLGDDVKEILNAMKKGKDFALSNSTGTVLTITGLLFQLLGGSASWPEYIAPALGLYVNLLGFVAAIGSGAIKTDPLFVALTELYDEIHAEEEPDIVGGAKKHLFANNEQALALYADYVNPTQVTAKPVILVDKPWYGPEVIPYCFVNREFGRQRAPDFIDENGNITNFWVHVNVRNTSLIAARIHVNFFYSIDDGPLQHLYDATWDKANGDELNPREIREYMYQEWFFSRSEVADVCRGQYKIKATVSVNGNYEEGKSVLQNSVQIWIPPHFQLAPISISSNVPLRTKEIHGKEYPLIREGDLITLSTKITNTGGRFEANKKLAVRWYVDTEEGKQIVIAKQLYGAEDGVQFDYGDEIIAMVDLDTTNFGLSSLGLSSMLRWFKAAILEKDFSDCIAENMPLFTDKQEVKLGVEFDSWTPLIQIKQLNFSNRTPTEGEKVLCGCTLRNPEKVPVNVFNNLTMDELAEDGKIVLRTHRPKTEFVAPTFITHPFDSGNSNEGIACKSMSFDFIPISNMWVDSLKIRPKPGTADQVKCTKIRILYLGWPIISADTNWDPITGIHYLNHPVFLEAEREYHFEIEIEKGIPMIGDRILRIAHYDVIRNSVITLEDGSFLYKHPKMKLLLLKTLPPESEARIELVWDTLNRTETKFLRWNFTSAAQNLEVSKIASIEISPPEIRGFKLVCEEPVQTMDRIRIAEYQIKAIWENQDPSLIVQNISVTASGLAPTEDSEEYKLYIKPQLNAHPIPAKNVAIELKNHTTGEFIVGIAASRKIVMGKMVNFAVKAQAIINALYYDQPIQQTLESILQLQFYVSSDFTEIFDITSSKMRKEIQREENTEYIIMLYNRVGKPLNINLFSTGKSQDQTKDWDYYFIETKKKKLEVELGLTPEDLKFRVKSELPNEISNTLTAKYSWDPLDGDDTDYTLEKNIDLLTIFMEEPFPIGVNFRSSCSAVDPGVPFTLTALLTVWQTAEQSAYNITLKVDGNVDFISYPTGTILLSRGESQSLSWEVKLFENAPLGSKIPVKLVVKTGTRTTSAVLNIGVSNVRKEYDFVFKTDWRILSIVSGKQGIIKATVENIGRKADVIKLVARQMLPVGWYARPSIRSIGVKPDQIKAGIFTVTLPQSAKVGETGKVVITATSKKDPILVQRRQVTIKAARPGAKWSIELTPDNIKKSVGLTGASTFTITVTNNGNRQLGNVTLAVYHKYHPVQFTTKVSPKILNLLKPGSTGKASVVIEPKLTGPGNYKFDILARWQEHILKAEDRKTVRLEYSMKTFLTSKYGILLIGTGVTLIVTLLILFYFVF